MTIMARPAESRRRSRRGAVADIFEGVEDVVVQNLTGCESCLRCQFQEPSSRLRSRRNALPDVSAVFEEFNDRNFMMLVTCLGVRHAEEMVEERRPRTESMTRRNALPNIYDGIDEFSQQNFHNSHTDLYGNPEQPLHLRRLATPNIYEDLVEAEVENLQNFVHQSNFVVSGVNGVSSWESEEDLDSELSRLRCRRNGMANIFENESEY